MYAQVSPYYVYDVWTIPVYHLIGFDVIGWRYTFIVAKLITLSQSYKFKYRFFYEF
jgi:hypothetical protein